MNTSPIELKNWKVRKIAVIGPGIVGMPMAGMLADAKIKIGTDEPAKVVVVQRNSNNSGWKVDAINSGQSVIGGIEPALNDIVKNAVDEGLLSATHDYSELADCDVILVSVQTDKKGYEPDYGPLFGALEKMAEALVHKPKNNVPLIIFESTLAPTTMDTLIREHFGKYGLVEGRDILLGNSPNRVMPGRLVERIKDSDKLAGGLHPETPKLICHLYNHIVTNATVYPTNSLTAEIVKTLENAYRDVRIAFSAELVRYCDNNNIDFYAVRDKVNERLSQVDDASRNPNAVPSGGILIPMLGVGGHCLPKDGILLWWRNIAIGTDTSRSLIVNSRTINNESPVYTYEQAVKTFNNLGNKKIGLLGVAYRFNSEDTRNSPTLQLANYLRDQGVSYKMHDPYVKPDDQHLLMYNQEENFTNDFQEVLEFADYLFFCTAHKDYIEYNFKQNGQLPQGVIDSCNAFSSNSFTELNIPYTGIGRGIDAPTAEFVEFVLNSFTSMEHALGNELLDLIKFYNDNFAHDEYNKVEYKEVQRLARTCSTGCNIVDPEPITIIPQYHGFSTRLLQEVLTVK